MIDFYARTKYSLIPLDIPHVRGKALAEAVKYKLPGLFPGNIADHLIQIRKNARKKGAYLVFILEKNQGAAMLPLSPLFIQFANVKSSGNFIYLDNSWVEFIRLESGVISSSTVCLRDNARLGEEIDTRCGSPDEQITIYCSPPDEPFVNSVSPDRQLHFRSPQRELKNIDVHTISLFSEKSPVRKRHRIMAAVCLSVALAGICAAGYRRHKTQLSLIARQHTEQEIQKQIADLKKQEAQRLAELTAEYDALIAAKKATPFETAAVISACAGSLTRILSATLGGSFFQIEGTTVNALAMLRNFENHSMIDNVRLNQVRQSGGRETFTLNGNVKPLVVLVDTALLPSEQILKLETLIATEQYYGSPDDAVLTPSAFGEKIKTLLIQNKCTVNSYQYLNEEQKTMLEYSLLSTPDSFFTFLADISTNHRAWEINLVQIKNLFPRNALDIVFRINTVYVRPENQQSVPPQHNASPYPVAGIVRNYFTVGTAARPQVAQVTVPAPVAAVPARVEKAAWLEYLGTVNDADGARLMYLKNTRTGAVLKLGISGVTRYEINALGNIIAYIDNHVYEVSRGNHENR